MKRMGIEAIYRRPNRSKPEPGHKIFPYLLRTRPVTRPNQVWAVDICLGLLYRALAEAGIVPSVGHVGDSYDNALAETINGLYKAEVILRRPWRSFEAVEFATLEWVDWFNSRRLLEPIGNVPPAEAEALFYASMKEVPLAAQLKPSRLRRSRDSS
jgi:transposase InsO family protein